MNIKRLNEFSHSINETGNGNHDESNVDDGSEGMMDVQYGV